MGENGIEKDIPAYLYHNYTRVSYISLLSNAVLDQGNIQAAGATARTPLGVLRALPRSCNRRA